LLALIVAWKMKRFGWSSTGDQTAMYPLPLCGVNVSESGTAKMMARSVRFMQEASIDTADHRLRPNSRSRLTDSQPIEKTIPTTATCSNLNGQMRAAAIIPPTYLYLRKACLNTGSEHHRITPTVM
jgi:hypothetical protein